MIRYIDAHAHILEPFFKLNEVKNVITDALSKDVIKIVNCASDPSQFNNCLETSKFDEIEISIGLQPTLADRIINADPIRELSDNPLSKNIRAIGEVGLDYHWIKDENLRDRQKVLFIDCIELANEQQIPLVIHSRKAEMDALEILSKHAQVPVLLHSFEGNLKAVEFAKELEYKITVPTNVVIRRNRRKVAVRAGIENILLETDSPYCAPADDIRPNTPSTIPIVAEKLASIFEVELEELARITTNNTKNFYRI